ncbi:hypothetical protein [Lentibacillus salicampi]|uniref:hypothetical protein n=1 Tax=Lentibacillus salicampi TaxID=175306 RepID=UPI00142FFBA1|nr:hypothetical protein [Lentibacillus salicampi]
MYNYYYNPEVRYLLMSQVKGKAKVLYDNNPQAWPAPVIGPRPPYYTNPRYMPSDPVI